MNPLNVPADQDISTGTVLPLVAAPQTNAQELNNPTEVHARQYLRDYSQTLLDLYREVRHEIAQFTSYCGESRARPFDILQARCTSTVFYGDTWKNLEINNLILKIIGVSEESKLGNSGKLAEAVGLYRTIAQLPSEPITIRLRQDAVKEIADQTPAAKSLVAFFDKYPPSTIQGLFNKPGLDDNQYEWYHSRAELVRKLVNDAQHLVEPESVLLRQVFAAIKKLPETSVVKHYLHGSVYTYDGIKPTPDTSFNSRAFRFWPYPVDPVTMVCAAIPVGGTLSAVVGSAYQISEIANVSALVALAGTVITAFVYFGKKFIDRMMVVNPLAAKAQSELQELFSGATLVRELSLLNTFTSKTKQPTSFLTVLNQDSGSITMKQMGCPLHADLDPVEDQDLSLETLEKLKNRKVIRLNNIEQTNDAIQPDVGPNSGGKSFRRKAQFLNVILHQTGAKSFCAEGACAPFSKIFFAVPKLSESGSSEGSLGAELEPIGKFLHGTKVDQRTLVFCDELGRGTSESAIAPRATDILLTLQTAGARTSVASHNEPLIKSLQDDTLRLVPHHPEMLFLNGELYMTLRVLPGFPPKSSQPVVYADAVASKYGLGPEALAELRKAILLERGAANS